MQKSLKNILMSGAAAGAVVETPQPQPQPQAPQQPFVAKELPNTGASESDKLVALSGFGLLGLLGLGLNKRKED